MGRKKLSDIDRVRSQVWVNELLRRSQESSLTKLNEKLGMQNHEAWYKYAKGMNSPSKMTRNLVDQKYPGMNDIYQNGPCQLFTLIKETRIRDAVRCIATEIDRLLDKKGMNISETDFIPEETSFASWLEGFSLKLFKKRKEYGLSGEIIILCFAIAHIESRFLGSSNSLSLLVGPALKYLSKYFGVSPEYFEGDKDVLEAVSLVQVRCHFYSKRLPSILQAFIRVDPEPSELNDSNWSSIWEYLDV